MSGRKKFKIQCIELLGSGNPGALQKRDYPPGQLGELRKRRIFEFGAQPYEKQKLLFHYGLQILSNPDSKCVPFEFNKSQTAEYYARCGI